MLNEALKLVRLFHHLKQNELAEKLEISKSYLSEIEAGKKTPTLDLINKYSETFGLKPSSLLLFSESIQDDSFVEKSRIKIARKSLNILQWIANSKIENA